MIPFDLSKEIGVDYQATSPNLLASYLRIKPGEKLRTSATATSQASKQLPCCLLLPDGG